MTAGRIAEKVRCALPALVLGLTGVLALRRLDQNDTWWHLASGRWIAEHGAVQQTDTFSFTVRDHAWINLQWLFDLALYGLFRAGGADAVVLATAGVSVALFALLIVNLRRHAGALATALLALWLLAIGEPRFQARPELLSLFWLQLLLWLLAPARSGASRRVWLVPVVMLAWVNTHSLFVIGVYVLGCHMACAALRLVPSLPERRTRAFSFGGAPPRIVLAIGAAGLFATLFNPYLLEGVAFPAKLMSRMGGAHKAFTWISELASPFESLLTNMSIGAYQIFLVGGVLVAAAALLASIAPARAAAGEAEVPRFDLPGFLVFVGLAYLSVLARRNMALFALGAAPFVAGCGALLAARGAARPCVPGRRAAERALIFGLPPALLLLACFVMANGFYRWGYRVTEFGLGTFPGIFPVRAADFVREEKLPSRLWNDMDTGGYLTWARPFPEGVFLDGRTEVYDTEFFSTYIASLSDPGLWQAEADRWKISTVMLFHRWVNRRKLVSALAASPDWALVYLDEAVVVFVRRAGNEELIRRVSERFDPVRRQFEAELLAPSPRWPWPLGQAASVSGYGLLLALLGDTERAVTFYARFVEMGPLPAVEFSFRLDLANYYSVRGDRETARKHLRRAAEIDPSSRHVRDLRERIG